MTTRVVDADWRGSFASPWLSLDDESEDYRRNALFRTLSLETAAQLYPWLLPLIQAGKGAVYAAPGCFKVWMCESKDWIEIPAIGQHLTLTPWHDDEVAH